jgi:DNA-binding SARP family transcriptional activator
LASDAETRIQLCGRLVVKLEGRRVEDALPGRQGRALLAYLVVRRLRPVPRSELVETLWPGEAPAAVESALSALLSKLRRALGTDVVHGRSEVELRLPAGSWIDVEAAREALHRAEAAVAREEWTAGWAPARAALHIAARGFLVGHDGAWADEVRRELQDVHARALEAVGAVGLGLGGHEVLSAERSGRALVELEPFRESGYRLLMGALAARGNAAEALRVYDALRVLLREELGASPGAETQALHRRLLAPAGSR